VPFGATVLRLRGYGSDGRDHGANGQNGEGPKTPPAGAGFPVWSGMERVLG